jgi:aryl-alcohol dehydrogenase-like predicted oxidoreductase
VRSGMVDTVQVIYNVFDQGPEDELLEACAEHGVGVIVRVPFDEGALTGRITQQSTFADDDFRSSYFRDDRLEQVDEHVRAICDDLAIGRDELAEIALRYVLSAPQVSTVIPGMRSVRNVERNIAAGDGAGLPVDRVAALKAHRWDRNFYR